MLCALLAVAFGGLALTLLLTRSSAAHAASAGQVQQQISNGRSRISSLSGALNAVSSHLAQLNASVASLEQRISQIQRDLDAKRTELLRLRTELAAARVRLAQLEAFETRAEAVLSAQLVDNYETDRPDIVSVVLEARGFQDLLERIAFATRIRKQSTRVVARVRAARRAVTAQATQLGALEERQQTLTGQVLQQRDALAGAKIRLVQQQISVAQEKRTKAGQLSAARGRLAGLERQLSELQAAQTPAASGPRPASSSGSSSTGSGSNGGLSSGSTGSTPASTGGGFTFPMPSGSASPSGTWSLDDGVDIAAPGGTPELAVCSGTIVLHGIGGFGPWAPVLHCDSALDGYSYVYYGHAGPANQLPIGTHVSAGQTISEVGPGIVGISSGPHLEIGFCDSSGTPLGPSTAPQMMSLLHSSYGG